MSFLGKRTSVIVQAVEDIVQVQGMGQMGVQHGDHMAVGAEGTRLNLVLAGKVLDYFIRNSACNLGKNGHSMFLRVHGISFGCLVGFH